MTHLKIGDKMPDFALPDQTGTIIRLSSQNKASEFDTRLGFRHGYPLMLVFYRGFFCPRDNAQFRDLVAIQPELSVSYTKIVSVAVQDSIVQAAFAKGLGADWTFLADTERTVIRQLGLLDETEGEYPDVSRPFTFLLNPDLSIHAMYDGWYFMGRPTNPELRARLREIMAMQPSYHYDTWNADHVKQIRIPAKEWEHGAPPLGANGRDVLQGVVSHFSYSSGSGSIDVNGQAYFFNFSAIPGTGYRTIKAGTSVRFEVVDTHTGLSARNIQPV
jgi:peroxiredoxin/cold shock CspA family protein